MPSKFSQALQKSGRNGMQHAIHLNTFLQEAKDVFIHKCPNSHSRIFLGVVGLTLSILAGPT